MRHKYDQAQCDKLTSAIEDLLADEDNDVVKTCALIFASLNFCTSHKYPEVALSVFLDTLDMAIEKAAFQMDEVKRHRKH